MNVGEREAQNVREESPGQAGDWRQPPLSGAVPPLPGSLRRTLLPPRAPRNGESGSFQTPSNLDCPCVHYSFPWGFVRPRGPYLPGQSPPVLPLSQPQPVSQPPQVDQRRPSPQISGIQDIQSIQQWLDRASTAKEKATSVFGVVSKVCRSTDCCESDVQRLISISFEQMVRNLDYVAASKALKATTIQERKWSTEPNGQGFRMAGKEAKGYIDKNNIDPTLLIHSVTEDGLFESRPVHAVAEESVIEQQQAAWFRQTAEAVASWADIPLYTELDTFLEHTERPYVMDGEKAVSSGHAGPAGVGRSGQMRDGLDARDWNPPVGPPLHVQGHQNTQNEMNILSQWQGNGDTTPILVKEGYFVSTGTFDRRSNTTWNDPYPRYDGDTNLPWTEHEEIMVSAPTMAVMARDVLGDFNLPDEGTLRKVPRAAKATSSTKNGDGPVTAGATSGDSPKLASTKPAEKTPSSAPSCFCGDPCERKGSAGGKAYFGCQHSKCLAHIPMTDFVMPISNNDDSGTIVEGAQLPTAMPGSADDRTRENAESDSGVHSKSKSGAEASPNGNRKGHDDTAASPKRPPSPVRRVACDDRGATARLSRRIDNVSLPPLRNPENMMIALSRKSKRPRHAEDDGAAPSMEQMIQKELALVPAELRCRKPDPSGQGRVCLTSLKPGIDGAGPSKHPARCRYKPRTVVDDPTNPMDSYLGADARGNRKWAEGAETANDHVATQRSNSGKRVSESVRLGKPHWDGQGLLHREFAALSAKKIAASYRCSSAFPLMRYKEQKREFASQSEALRTHPMLHAGVVGDTDFGSCDVVPEDPDDAKLPAYKEEATGLFARHHLTAGSSVAELIGETISAAEAKRREGEYASLVASGGLKLTNIVGDNRGHLDQARGLMFNLNEHWVLDTTRAGSSARFARRIKDGNCRLAVAEDPAGAMHIYLQAISDVSEGEEITIRSVQGFGSNHGRSVPALAGKAWQRC